MDLTLRDFQTSKDYKPPYCLILRKFIAAYIHTYKPLFLSNAVVSHRFSRNLKVTEINMFRYFYIYI